MNCDKHQHLACLSLQNDWTHNLVSIWSLPRGKHIIKCMCFESDAFFSRKHTNGRLCYSNQTMQTPAMSLMMSASTGLIPAALRDKNWEIKTHQSCSQNTCSALWEEQTEIRCLAMPLINPVWGLDDHTHTSALMLPSDQLPTTSATQSHKRIEVYIQRDAETC